jgi:CubicO group peptidase (beta-lactamase class C family)
MLDAFVKFASDRRLDVDSVILTVGGDRRAHFFKEDRPENIRSISKVISCLGVCKAIEKGFYDTGTDVLHFFGEVEIFNKKNLRRLGALKIKHLLTLTMGHEKGFMFRGDISELPEGTDYVSHILNYDIKHEPGTFFAYSNAATYLLCALTQRLTGKYFDDWVRENLFSQLDISDFHWERSSQNICWGGTGLHLSNSDLHKIGLLLLNDGIYDGKRVIDPDWVREMRTPKIITANLPEYSKSQDLCVNKMAYGYHMWISGDGSARYPKEHYFCDGTDGQFLIISPKKNMVISILSHQKDMNPFYEILPAFLAGDTGNYPPRLAKRR